MDDRSAPSSDLTCLVVHPAPRLWCPSRRYVNHHASSPVQKRSRHSSLITYDRPESFLMKIRRLGCRLISDRKQNKRGSKTDFVPCVLKP
ncbi:hypothetical protein BRADI_1g75425v3 [Brachypodium distachyon]|uniref:Uncharacterized protein n=1 Tax=Brachypodium distachyon TaxID=15368 RepID=A0A0Q3K1H1_BRADI|nr:hypothetical protein BRADI_1g75425v3 [Brachypodium distachyon]